MYEDEKSFYLVNPSGTVHNLPETLARERLRLPGWRMATKEEITILFKRKGVQNTKSRIAEPWSPEPPAEQELPDQAMAKKDEKKVAKKAK